MADGALEPVFVLRLGEHLHAAAVVEGAARGVTGLGAAPLPRTAAALPPAALDGNRGGDGAQQSAGNRRIACLAKAADEHAAGPLGGEAEGRSARSADL